MSSAPPPHRAPAFVRQLTACALALVAACGRGAEPPADMAAPSAPAPAVSRTAAREVAASGFAGSAGSTSAGDGATESTAPEMPATLTGQTANDSAAAAPNAAQAPAAAGAMLIRTGQASVEVDSLDPAVARVRALAARLGGYVGNTTLASGRDQVRSATLELKLPAPRFQEALAGLAPLGRVDSVNATAEDVGEEFVDVSARVANARRLEARLLALVERRADKLADVLALERELANVREQIERYDGRLRFLRSRAALSTLTVTVHERAPLVGTSPVGSPVADAFRQAWRNFVGFVAALIAASGVLVPLGVIAWLVWFGTRRVRRLREADVRAAGARAERAAPNAESRA